LGLFSKGRLKGPPRGGFAGLFLLKTHFIPKKKKIYEIFSPTFQNPFFFSGKQEKNWKKKKKTNFFTPQGNPWIFFNFFFF